MKIQILGTRGIPAQHGGFETFVEAFTLYLVGKGWNVTVYCQEEGKGPVYENEWKGVHLVHVPVHYHGAFGTIVFDWKVTLLSGKREGLVLICGYNTGIFSAYYKLKRRKNIINMDGIEWRRGKYGMLACSWLYLNEKFAAWLGDHLVADNPEIKKHLASFVSKDKVTVIPYSADIIDAADESLLKQFELIPRKYLLIIARPEPENSILEIVRAFSKSKRGVSLVILGDYNPEANRYHKQVIAASSAEVKFLGAIYDKSTVQALRFFSYAYIHGHTVGGTNPSLVEALGAGSAVLAHDNRFNKWVAGSDARFFVHEQECENEISRLLNDDYLVEKMRIHSRRQMKDKFTKEVVHRSYEQLLLSYQN